MALSLIFITAFYVWQGEFPFLEVIWVAGVRVLCASQEHSWEPIGSVCESDPILGYMQVLRIPSGSCTFDLNLRTQDLVSCFRIDISRKINGPVWGNICLNGSTGAATTWKGRGGKWDRRTLCPWNLHPDSCVLHGFWGTMPCIVWLCRSGSVFRGPPRNKNPKTCPKSQCNLQI